jgi:lipopolysaccharide transport system permease protein
MSTIDQAGAAQLTVSSATKPRRTVEGRRTHIRPRKGWQAVNLRELWHARDLLWMFMVRDIQIRYKQTFFGYLWALVVPVMQIVVFTVFFGMILGVSNRVNRAIGLALPYPLFALTGQIAWNFFKATVDGSSNSMLSNAHIIRKIYMPRLVLPLAALGRPLIDAAVVFVLMTAMLAFYVSQGNHDIRFSPTFALSPLILLGSAVPALGIGLIVSAITVHYRDLQHVMPFMTQIMFYATPVIYSVDVLPARVASFIYLNPMAGFVQAHRAAVLGLPIDWTGLGVSFGFSLVLLVFGLFYFARSERHFADVA